MRVPLSWLGDFVELDGSPDELAELLTNAGLEVKAIDRFGVDGADLSWPADLVMAARVLRVDPVPDADRLVLATVDYGADSTRQVITGAPNLFPYLDQDLGDDDLWGALLLAGASYRNPYRDLKITRLKPKKLRGITSDAMLCSAAELGLGEDHEGIILFEPADELPALEPGRPLTEVLGDAVLDIDVIPNIARCASIMGVAREVAALTGAEFRPPAVPLTMDGPPIEGRVEITTENPELNPRFVALLIEGIEQGSSPYWMQHRLQLAGQRPISNVVDISNYVMLEVGQPNHTFDYDLLRQRADSYAKSGPVRIVTRLAHEGERLTTLDGTERELRANQIMVTDPAGSLSVGGVMGGRDSEIGPETRNVLLEAAAWERRGIRRTQRQLGVHTEAGFRFSRGVHPSQALLGARRAAELLRLHAGGTIAEGIVDHYPQPAPSVAVDFDLGYLRRLSGLDLSAEETAELLRRLEFGVDAAGDSGPLRVTVPDHRLDIEGQHDLVEEVCRIYGYDRIPSTVLSDVLPPQRGNREQVLRRPHQGHLRRPGTPGDRQLPADHAGGRGEAAARGRRAAALRPARQSLDPGPHRHAPQPARVRAGGGGVEQPLRGPARPVRGGPRVSGRGRRCAARRAGTCRRRAHRPSPERPLADRRESGRLLRLLRHEGRRRDRPRPARPPGRVRRRRKEPRRQRRSAPAAQPRSCSPATPNRSASSARCTRPSPPTSTSNPRQEVRCSPPNSIWT